MAELLLTLVAVAAQEDIEHQQELVGVALVQNQSYHYLQKILMLLKLAQEEAHLTVATLYFQLVLLLENNYTLLLVHTLGLCLRELQAYVQY